MVFEDKNYYYLRIGIETYLNAFIKPLFTAIPNLDRKCDV